VARLIENSVAFDLELGPPDMADGADMPAPVGARY
jgi:hypothetical protein